MSLIFTDFWNGFDSGKDMHICNPRDFWSTLFHQLPDVFQQYDTIEISTVFGKTKPLPASSIQYGRTLRIAWSGENQKRHLENYDLNLIMQNDDLSKHIICFPLAFYTLLEYQYLHHMDIGQFRLKPHHKHADSSQTKQKFCVFVVSNGQCEVRNRFFHKLNQYKPVEARGRFLNDSGIFAPANRPQQHQFPLFDFLNQYKFTICFENSASPSYCTEKLLYAWMGNTIPIYWGASRATEWFNNKAFLMLDECADDHAMNKLIVRIRELDNDPEQYEAMRREPLLLSVKPFSLESFPWKSTLQHRHWPAIEHVFCICNADKEPKHYQAITEQMKTLGVPRRYYTFWSPTYGELTLAQKTEFEIQEHGLTNGEMSLLYNFYSLAKHIRDHWTQNEVFIILEADVILLPVFVSFMQHLSKRDCDYVDPIMAAYDFITLGAGDQPVETLSFSSNDNVMCMESAEVVRCTEATLWTREGFCRLLSSSSPITKPLDWHFNSLISDKILRHHRTMQPLAMQGSKNGTFASTLETQRKHMQLLQQTLQQTLQQEIQESQRSEQMTDELPEMDDSNDPEQTTAIVLTIIVAFFALLLLCLFSVYI